MIIKKYYCANCDRLLNRFQVHEDDYIGLLHCNHCGEVIWYTDTLLKELMRALCVVRDRESQSKKKKKHKREVQGYVRMGKSN